MSLRSLWGQERNTTPTPPDITSGGAGPAARPADDHTESASPHETGEAASAAPVGVPQVAELLQQVIDPEIGVNIVDLGLIYDIRIESGVAKVNMSLTTPGCPLSAYMEDSVGRALDSLPGIDDVFLRIVWDPAWDPSMMSMRAKRELGWPV